MEGGIFSFEDVSGTRKLQTVFAKLNAFLESC